MLRQAVFAIIAIYSGNIIIAGYYCRNGAGRRGQFGPPPPAGNYYYSRRGVAAGAILFIAAILPCYYYLLGSSWLYLPRASFILLAGNCFISLAGAGFIRLLLLFQQCWAGLGQAIILRAAIIYIITLIAAARHCAHYAAAYWFYFSVWASPPRRYSLQLIIARAGQVIFRVRQFTIRHYCRWHICWAQLPQRRSFAWAARPLFAGQFAAAAAIFALRAAAAIAGQPLFAGPAAIRWLGLLPLVYYYYYLLLCRYYY